MARHSVNQVLELSLPEQRYMAFEGLVQWTLASVRQVERIEVARLRLNAQRDPYSPWDMRSAVFEFHTECHFLAVSAWKVIEHRKWVGRLELCSEVDFGELDKINESDVKDLRDMREHVVEYFCGSGRKTSRWIKGTTEYSCDASSVVGTLIGARLDWVAFKGIAQNLLEQLRRSPIPYPDVLP